MIYTVTFNPALDYYVTVDDLKMGMTNRTSSELMLPGGKGINVSVLLSHLGIPNTALGFVAGFTGDEICRRLEAEGISTDFIKIAEGQSRINIKIKNIDGMEINGSGPVITSDKVEALMRKLDQLTDGDVLVLAGSIPSGMPSNIYQQIMAYLEEKNILIAVDATQDLLRNVLPYHPFLIKPNHHELGELFGVTIERRNQVPTYAKRLQAMGARHVLVSMGGMGAVLAAEDGRVYEADAPQGLLRNAVGAGDSMVAGFLAGWLASHDGETAFKMGVASGSASAFSDFLASRADIDDVYTKCFAHIME